MAYKRIFFKHEGKKYDKDDIINITGYGESWATKNINAVNAGEIDPEDVLERNKKTDVRYKVKVVYTAKNGEVYDSKRVSKIRGLSMNSARWLLKGVISGKFTEKALEFNPESVAKKWRADEESAEQSKKLDEFDMAVSGELSQNKWLGYHD